MFYQMLYGQKPFANNVSQQKILQDNLIGKDVQLEFPSKTKSNNSVKVSEEAKAFIRSCLVADQESRPDVLSICDHNYLLLSKSKPKMPPPNSATATRKGKASGSVGSLPDMDDS
jgi:tousled-like kinase